MKLYNNIIKNALISVFDKCQILQLANGLLKNNIKIFSTTGTRKELKKYNIKVHKIDEITKYPEIMDGQIKTIHPKIFGGILGNKKDNKNTIQDYKITIFDIIIINCRPFNMILNDQNPEKSIDIGGPSMIRAAIKNYKNTVIITDISDYQIILKKINQYQYIDIDTKTKLAYKALKYVTKYDSNIKKYFSKKTNIVNNNKKNILFPNILKMIYIKKQDLKYGENPHQKSSFYIMKKEKKGLMDSIRQIHGTSLSYNNISDANTAIECVNQFSKPTCVIIKHGNPCGAATSNDPLSAYILAYQSDPISAFGGIISFNCMINEKTIQKILKTQFVEIIIAPYITLLAIQTLKTKKNIKLLIYKNKNQISNIPFEFKTINDGLLIQETNIQNIIHKNWKIVSKKKPNIYEIQDAIFCWKIIKFVKSNAIIYGKNSKILSIGAGQTSRIDAVKIANFKYYQNNKNLKSYHKNIIMASDAFFPFQDGIKKSLSMNISCIIQPGGSIRDSEIIEIINQHNIAMIFTEQRNFKH